MKWTTCLFILLSLLICNALLAQPGSFKISGAVTDSSGQVLPAVTVMLLKSVDSSTTKITSTDNSGNYVFEQISPGQYHLSITATGYMPHRVALPPISISITANPIRLQRAPTMLKGVTVIARKPLIELLPDKTVINVDAAVTNVGATALEVLENHQAFRLTGMVPSASKAKPMY
ncbi:carboxypeptidase-like regulatory domain-containing protein [Paraflavitalea speifideaquila]|uniref:carboxypeptidase-like regulatory domain-containing protein n=1 Tax=Paraflavitalea speifideaquila TaxID=3076558 RepID=UPI0028EBB58F|nr:carboxypeptidase-like regulatory domain-containing protein [Paraflavitalea speifideiaquila]